MSPLEILRRENDLLKQTITEATDSITSLESSLEGANIPVPPAEGEPVSSGGPSRPAQLQPEDFWSPSIEVPAGYAYVDEYGKISPIPAHDGTECFKWDNTLWAKQDHFRVSGSRGGCREPGGGQQRTLLPHLQQHLPCHPHLPVDTTRQQPKQQQVSVTQMIGAWQCMGP
jgi:hypothetical protein